MGIEKAKWEEGYSSISGTVCSDCFGDYGIKQFIEDNTNSNKCSYCDSNGSETIACDIEDVVVHILESIKCEWGDPANEGVGWESREGGWLGANVYDTYDLIYDELAIEVENENILSDIYSSINLFQWCKKDPYSSDENIRLLYAWNNFTELVKHNSRYVFLGKDDCASPHDEMNPVDILKNLGEIIYRLNLVKILDRNKKIYRVRITDNNITFNTAKDLGSPPKEYATLANRMSPAGIPMFYGAFDIETAISETYEKEENTTKHAVCGIFTPARDLNVIDLSEELFIPSLFDEENRDNRYFIKFLQDFIADFVKPIERVDSAHINYVPTQIVTEYFKHIYHQNEFGEQIDGIIYPSSKNGANKCIVIFADSNQCIDIAGHTDNDVMLVLDAIQTKEI